MSSLPSRVLFIGLDGGTRTVLRPLFERGWMPNLASFWRGRSPVPCGRRSRWSRRWPGPRSPPAARRRPTASTTSTTWSRPTGRSATITPAPSACRRFGRSSVVSAGRSSAWDCRSPTQRRRSGAFASRGPTPPTAPTRFPSAPNSRRCSGPKSRPTPTSSSGSAGRRPPTRRSARPTAASPSSRPRPRPPFGPMDWSTGPP